MAIDLVTVQGLWPVLSRVPTLVGWLGQWYFTPERLAKLVYADLFPRHESARVDLGGVASFQLHLQLMNLTPFELELDRANFYFSCSGVRLEASILERRKIASGATESLFLSGSIPDGAANQIATAIWNNQGSLEGNIEFNARVRSFAKRIGVLSGIQVSIINAHTRLRQPAHSNA